MSLAGTTIDDPEDDTNFVLSGEGDALIPYGTTTLADNTPLLIIVKYWDDDEDPVEVTTGYGDGIVESGSWWTDPEGNDIPPMQSTDDRWKVYVYDASNTSNLVLIAEADGTIEEGV